MASTTVQTIGDVSKVDTSTLQGIRSLISSGMDKLDEDMISQKPHFLRMDGYSEEDIEDARSRWDIGTAALTDLDKVIEARENSDEKE